MGAGRRGYSAPVQGSDGPVISHRVGRQRARRLGVLAFALAPLLALTAACSAQPAPLSAADPIFAGLDPAVVSEALAHPQLKENWEGLPDDDKARAQNAVRNFANCRASLWVYQEWLRSGKAPSYPPQARPTNPQKWAADMDREVELSTKLASGGDISALRADLVNESGCGSWIPAKPGDINGPTVGDVVRRS